MSIALESTSNRIEGSGFIHGISRISIFESPEPGRSIHPGDRGNMALKEELELDSCTSSSIGRNSDLSGRSTEDEDAGETEVQSSYKGPLDTMDALEEVLPIRRGISKFYCGKSKSFTSLADASSYSSVKDIAKPENTYTRKRKNLLACSNILDKNLNWPLKSSSGGLSKRPANSSRSTLAFSIAMSSSESNNNSENSNSNSNSLSPPRLLPPLHPQVRPSFNNASSSPLPRQNLSNWRSFSLTDLQSAADATTSAVLPGDPYPQPHRVRFVQGTPKLQTCCGKAVQQIHLFRPFTPDAGLGTGTSVFKLIHKEAGHAAHEVGVSLVAVMADPQKLSLEAREDDGLAMEFSKQLTLKYINESISIPAEAIASGIREFQLSLVGKLVSDRPVNLGVAQKTLCRAWNTRFHVQMVDLENSFTLFKFSSESELMRVFNHQPWSFNGHPWLLTKWSPNLLVKDLRLTSIPIWMQIHALPPEYLLREVGEVIAGRVGELLEVDLPKVGIEKGKFLRIRVQVDISQPLRPFVSLKLLSGELAIFPVAYERLPTFCFKCGCIGHGIKHCLVVKGCPGEDATKSFDLFGSWMRAEIFHFESWPLKNILNAVGILPEQGDRAAGEERGAFGETNSGKSDMEDVLHRQLAEKDSHVALLAQTRWSTMSAEVEDVSSGEGVAFQRLPRGEDDRASQDEDMLRSPRVRPTPHGKRLSSPNSKRHQIKFGSPSHPAAGASFSGNFGSSIPERGVAGKEGRDCEAPGGQDITGMGLSQSEAKLGQPDITVTSRPLSRQAYPSKTLAHSPFPRSGATGLPHIEGLWADPIHLVETIEFVPDSQYYKADDASQLEYAFKYIPRDGNSEAHAAAKEGLAWSIRERVCL
ncbi:hypothetical protein HHK36_032810 [Tetracentron sinense]|uniref:CCHC-type domain-containing protein n=1 Tax=Tetracentron sinense TaxID=13715 RepID=A0A834Y4E1_TETSI|nr:hypothetical protein HHK36_032810 [Tetracentron sinense]